MPSTPLRINVIGCGNVGKTLLYLWHQKKQIIPGSILNTSLESAQASVKFIGAGTAVSSIEDMQPADVFLIGCSDNYISACCDNLSNSTLQIEDKIVFHCSGALGSDQLESAADKGALVASAHPVKSFSNPAESVASFSGSYVGLEGKSAAIATLEQLFKSIDGLTFSINSSEKTLYHAATVMACNYLVTLQDISLNMLLDSGIDLKMAHQILQPLVANTAANIFSSSPAEALTGPIARGDHQTIKRHLLALDKSGSEISDIYKQLGEYTVSIARRQGNAHPEDLKTIEKLLSTES